MIFFISFLCLFETINAYLSAMNCSTIGSNLVGIKAHIEMPCDYQNCIIEKGLSVAKIHFKTDVQNYTNIEANAVLIGWNDGLRYFGLTVANQEAKECKTNRLLIYNSNYHAKCPLKEGTTYTYFVDLNIEKSWKPNSVTNKERALLMWQLNAQGHIGESTDFLSQCNKIIRMKIRE